jgi:hypothetical protein
VSKATPGKWLGRVERRHPTLPHPGQVSPHCTLNQVTLPPGQGCPLRSPPWWLTLIRHPFSVPGPISPGVTTGSPLELWRTRSGISSTAAQAWLATPYCTKSGRQTDIHNRLHSLAWALPVQLLQHLFLLRCNYDTGGTVMGPGPPLEANARQEMCSVQPGRPSWATR